MKLITLMVLFISLNVYAQEDSAIPTTVKVEKAPSKEAKAQVLDFNANVIEGELKKPQLFLELGGDVKDFNSLLLIRDDFNDYQVVDMKNRLRYVEIK